MNLIQAKKDGFYFLLQVAIEFLLEASKKCSLRLQKLNAMNS